MTNTRNIPLCRERTVPEELTIPNVGDVVEVRGRHFGSPFVYRSFVRDVSLFSDLDSQGEVKLDDFVLYITPSNRWTSAGRNIESVEVVWSKGLIS